MRLYLRIAVYRGGQFWKECWESVKENLDLFDGVYISFNRSELQEEDIAVIQDVNSDKIHWIRQEKFLTAVQHGKVFSQWLHSLHLEGHIYFLCHDDILVRSGLLELRALDLKESDIVFCGALFFQEGQEHDQGSVALELQKYPLPMTLEHFFSISESVLWNVSRLVVSCSLFRKEHQSFDMLSYGYYAEFCYCFTPVAEQVYSTNTPAVKIRRHENSEGAVMYPSLFLFDSIFMRIQAFYRFRSRKIRMDAAAYTGYMLRKHFFPGIFYFLQAQLRLMKAGYAHPFTGLEMAGYYIWNLIQKKTAGNTFLLRIFSFFTR